MKLNLKKEFIIMNIYHSSRSSSGSSSRSSSSSSSARFVSLLLIRLYFFLQRRETVFKLTFISTVQGRARQVEARLQQQEKLLKVCIILVLLYC